MFAQPNANAAIFITFTGNCKQALTFYQSCFGGLLQFESFGATLSGFPNQPVISGILTADRITIRGSDLVHNEGRVVGNHIAVYLHCEDAGFRWELYRKLVLSSHITLQLYDEELTIIEVIDRFDVRWLLRI